ncbi:ARM repeat-containing protein [Xylona heveae TC161]|uniref:ARM repeat-containing protein n=1 Tax=Xylona heveae (strain CBS 132557 / TC161) TaxID=1328760 RepID=A0A165JIA0_XYLHT|nr:ARM repeat-containing protein [Xylona heveae TC161]KZF26276.1 ARM repeat-containing protein [Xylona heveae TC161]
MANLKRKGASEAARVSSEAKSKKVKVEKSTAKPSKIQSLESNSVSDDFEGLSDQESSSDDGSSTLSIEKESKNDEEGSKKGKPTGNSSRESHAKQKALAQERKSAKPNSDIIQRSKKLWERLRRKSHVPRDERKELVAELYDIITGRVKDFVLKHDSVRVIQTALKYATLEQRKMIARELKGEYCTLAEGRYAKFLVGKLLVHGDAEVRDIIVPEFYGHVRRLIKHPEASWILDDIYRGIATPRQKACLLREWYGPEYAIFKTNNEQQPTSDLSVILSHNPEKRAPVMQYMHELINLLAQKRMTGFTILHDAMLQYFLNTKPGSHEANEFLELLKGDEEGGLLKNLAFTKSGARVVCLALAYGSAKDRKQILKFYKDLIVDLAFDSFGHQILLAAYDVIDDTVLTSKSIFPELLGKDAAPETQADAVLACVVSLNARIPLLYLFADKAVWLLPPEDVAVLEEIDQIRASTSKKDSNLRRRELIRAISPTLLSVTQSHASTMLETSFGCQFVTELLLGCDGDKEAALDAVADQAVGNPGKEGHVAQSPAVGRMLKTLVQEGHFNSKTKEVVRVDPPLNFHNILYERIKDHILDWATGPSSFVVVGLVEADGFSEKDGLLKLLKKGKKALEAAASPPRSKVSAESKKGSSKDGKSAKNPPAQHSNKGAKILLEKLS